MIFSSSIFVQFYLLAFFSFWLVRLLGVNLGNKWPKFDSSAIEFLIVFLIIFSLFFYGFSSTSFVFLLLWISIFDFISGKLIFSLKSLAWKRFLLILSLCNGLGILGFFKYYGFFAQNYAFFINQLGFNSYLPILEMILPVGISFYTFQSLSYVIDIYRGEILPEEKYIHYLLFLSFFPQLVAGPVVTAREFLPQLQSLRRFSEIPFAFALFLILIGAFKKAVLADHLAVPSDFAFANVQNLDPSFLWWGMFSYAGQIYCDFSGYTDIAQGTALMLGFRLPENFRMPYLSLGFSEFWTRWHISLSSWLRSYLYIPLGGNRKGNVRTLVNLMIVMLLGGLWHGANWNFVFWGGGHGLLLILERGFRNLKGFLEDRNICISGRYATGFLKILGIAFTFLAVCFLWIFFRSPDFHVSLCYLQGLFLKNGDISLPHTWFLSSSWCFFAIVVGHVFGTKFFTDNSRLEGIFSNWEQSTWRTVLLGALFSLALVAIVVMSAQSRPFVYFVF
ncbi:MBOAT family protein [Leptospira idonii]|uniref:MBOAT family protein n=1 Tax=Leptospira idonii TaxID=1193500 RepID=A0A4R9M197_9LEPT|nr:MBOAT family protein [Leptospira idonii]